VPGSNTGYWAPKLRRNVERDLAAQQALVDQGWDVLIVWECQMKDRSALADMLRSFIDREAAEIR